MYTPDKNRYSNMTYHRCPAWGEPGADGAEVAAEGWCSYQRARWRFQARAAAHQSEGSGKQAPDPGRAGCHRCSCSAGVRISKSGFYAQTRSIIRTGLCIINIRRMKTESILLRNSQISQNMKKVLYNFIELKYNTDITKDGHRPQRRFLL